jgi:hypothetical protein
MMMNTIELVLFKDNYKPSKSSSFSAHVTARISTTTQANQSLLFTTTNVRESVLCFISNDQVFLLRAKPVHQQPNINFHNSFGLTNDEQYLKLYECQEGCSSCGPKTSTMLTNHRLITRFEQKVGCCSKTHIDTSLFLSDIELMREGGTSLGCIGSCLACIRMVMSCQCCCERPKPLTFGLGNSVEILNFNKNDALGAATEITTAVVAAKKNRGH